MEEGGYRYDVRYGPVLYCAAGVNRLADLRRFLGGIGVSPTTERTGAPRNLCRISEVASMGDEEPTGTKMQQTGHSATSTTVEQAEVVEVGGVKWDCTPGQQCSTDSRNLKARPRPTAPGANLALKMDLGELTCV